MITDFQSIPFQNIKQFGQRTMLTRPLFSVSWILGRFCNYNCSYCWPYARSDKLDYQPFEVYTNTIDEIKRQARQNGFNQFHWSFSGGEPTAYKHLLELTSYLNLGYSSYQSIHMTTNLSPGVEWWNKWLKVTEYIHRKSITASYHTEFANEQEFGDKILMLQSYGVYVTINQVMVPDQFDELYARCERFKERGINVTLKPQSNETASGIVDGYTDSQVVTLRTEFTQVINDQELFQIKLTDGKDNYFIDQAERFNSFGFNQFKDWTCNSGYQSVIIRGNEVKRGYSCHDVLLGTLTEGFNLFKEPQVCTTPSCVSSADSKIPKQK
jgi:organic radical activating enzyme